MRWPFYWPCVGVPVHWVNDWRQLGLIAGIDAKGLDPNLDCHHLVVNDWEDLEASQNVCIISIPSVFDPSLAPAGKATIHAYVAANEPYDLWKGLDRKSKEYKDLKVMSLLLWLHILYCSSFVQIAIPLFSSSGGVSFIAIHFIHSKTTQCQIQHKYHIVLILQN